MDSIYLEKQEGQLCAQHCLNNLLQGQYFSAVDLAGFARSLDEAEKARMAEGDITPSGLNRLMQQPSTNMDDSGFFSVQVISNALRVWSLDMVPLSSPAMKHAMEDPTSQKAFICNHDYHWLTVRKLGHQWFNLDSFLKKPKLVSNTYLSLFLTQLQMEGYSIFVIEGDLPSCEADELLTLVPVEPEHTPTSPTHGGQSSCTCSTSKKDTRTHESEDEEESFALELATAMSASLAATEQEPKETDIGFSGQKEAEEREKLDLELATVISASLDDQETQEESSWTTSDQRQTVPLSDEELRQRRLLHLESYKNPDAGEH